MIGNYSIFVLSWLFYIWSLVLDVVMFYEEFDKLDRVFLKDGN